MKPKANPRLNATIPRVRSTVSVRATVGLLLIGSAVALAGMAAGPRPSLAGPPRDRSADPIPQAYERPKPTPPAAARSMTAPQPGAPRPGTDTAGPAAPAVLTVTHIEATQAIQDVDHTVPLMANRDLYIRVLLNIGGEAANSDSAGVTGKLTAQLASGETLVLDNLFDEFAPRVTGAQNGNLDAQRGDALNGLVFLVPADSVRPGNLTLSLIQVAARDGDRQISCGNCTSLTRTVVVQESAPPIRLTVIGISFKIGDKTYEPRALDLAMVPSWLRRAYPVSQIIYDTRVLPFPDANARPEAGIDCRSVNTFLAQVRAADVAGGLDPRTRYYGMVYEGDADQPQQFMRGCAVSIPDVPDPSATASGPTGASKWGWDDSGSYGGWYTAHEVGHTLGRRHVGGACKETGADPAFPFPLGRISTDAATFVGFDPGDMVGGGKLGPLTFPGRQNARLAHDVMSYCPWQWVSPYTYANIRQRLTQEDQIGSGTLTSGPSPQLAATSGASPAPAPAKARSAAPVVRTAATAEPYLHVLVRVEDGWTTGKLVSLTPTGQPVTSGVARSRSPSSANTPVIETLAADGRVLARIPVEVQAFTDDDKDGLGPQPAGLINISIPVDPSVAGIRVVYAGKTLAESRAGNDRPTVSSTAPAVTRSVRGIGPSEDARAPSPAPAPSSVPAAAPRPFDPNDPIVLSWGSTYRSSKALTYTVQLSTDAGASWQTVAVGLKETRVEIQPKALNQVQREQRATGRPMKYKVIANDGYNSKELVGDVR